MTEGSHMHDSTVTRSRVNAQLAIWLALGAALIAVGFAIEALADPVHHLLLILGGMSVGAGLSRTRRGDVSR
jgi:hypothetical protein